MMSEWEGVRRYKPQDREDVFCIAADTAFFGEPVETLLEDRRVFCDAFVRYYTDFEPEHAWVACVEDQVVGYLTGTVDTITQRRLWINKVLPSVAWNAIKGKYKVGKKTWRYTRGMISGMVHQEYPHADLRVYPAHLHINLDAAARGRGLGRGLMAAYLDQLRQLGVPGVHLNTTSVNEAACRLYEKNGYRLLDERPTQVWSHLLNQPVENRSYGLRLEGKVIP